ncbi:MAG: glycosyltransferase [bacterium]|nr:glycosyltransferase [bacterium]
MPAPTFSFVFPTYNEKDNIKILIPTIINIFKGLIIEIIIVDDGSTDGTIEEIQKFQKEHLNIFLVKRNRLGGIGSALIAGYNSAKGEYIISCDSDLSFSFDGIKEIADKLMLGTYDLVLGSRYLKGSYYEAPNSNILKKKLISKFGNIFLRFVTFIPVSDFSADCRGIKNSIWKNLGVKSRDNFMLFETVWRVYRAGGSIREVPVKFHDRRFGVSKLKLRKEFFVFFSQLFKLYFSHEK